MTIFKGSGVALITPFNESGVDYAKLEELLNWHISEGTDAIVICATTGEGATMTDAEKKETIKFTVDVVNKRIPVIANTGTNNTQASIEMSKYAESVGVDGLLVITPYYNKTNKEGLFKHFEAINNSVSTPIMLYNVPSRTSFNLTPQDLFKISKLSNVVAIKEASGDLAQIIEMKVLCGDDIDIYSGEDTMITPVLSIGGIGVISVLANVAPKATHELVMSYLNGDTEKSAELQRYYFNLVKNLFIETNPIPVKTALNLMGKNIGQLRLPLFEMAPHHRDHLERTLREYNLL